MSSITSSVGARAPNRPADVAAVQVLLNLRTNAFGMLPVRTDGICDASTIRAIRNFQLRCMAQPQADGRIDPTGRTFAALSDTSASAVARDIAAANAARARLSGAAWFQTNQARYPNSSQLADLTPAFSAQAGAFIGALRRAQATVIVSATRRNRTRAWLMHYSWRLSLREIEAGDIPPDPDCDILWDHGAPEDSRRAAAQMVELFQIAFRPSLNSNHIRGTAVDMSITWSGPIDIVDAAGKTHRIDAPRTGAANTALHTIGASYGVRKLITDRPHWSADGH